MSLTRRTLALLLLAALAVLVGLDFTVEHHAYFGIDGTPGFAAWYGLLASFGAAGLALLLARLPRRKGGDDG